MLLIFTNTFSGDQEERHPPDQEIQVRVIITILIVIIRKWLEQVRVVVIVIIIIIIIIIIIRKWLEDHTVVSWGYMSKLGLVVYCGF